MTVDSVLLSRLTMCVCLSLCVLLGTLLWRPSAGYLSRRDVCVSDVSMNVLNLRQLSLRHLNQLRSPQVTVATQRSVPPQWSFPFSLHGPGASSLSPPGAPLPPLPPLPPQGPSVPQLSGYSHWVLMAGVLVEFWGTWWRPFLFLIPILLKWERRR